MQFVPLCRAVCLAFAATVSLASSIAVAEEAAAFPPPKPPRPIKLPKRTPTLPPDFPGPIAIPRNPQPWEMNFTRGCIVTHKYGVFGELDNGPWVPLTYDIDRYNQCRPYTPQTTPPRTPAGIYAGEPALPPSPPPLPPGPPPIIVPPGPDIDGDGEPEETTLTTEDYRAAVEAACGNDRGGGVQWGSVGDRLVINGMGGGGDAQLSGGDIAGSSAVNGDSILVASGFKVSDNVDLTVQLPGTDFVLSRNFTGEKQWPLGGQNLNSAGSGWTMSFDAGVQFDLQAVTYGAGTRREFQHVARWKASATATPGDGFEQMGTAVVAVSPIRDSVMFTNHRWYRSDNGGEPPALPADGDGSRMRNVREFFPVGPRMQRLEAGFWQVTYGTTVVKRPAWILKDPGGGTSVFFRSLVSNEVTPASWSITPSAAEVAATAPGASCYDAKGLEDYPAGALWQQIDPSGHVWTYHHQRPSLNGCARAKLVSIVLQGVEETDSTTKAVVDVEWYENGDTSGVTGDVVGGGALRQVSVRRPFSTSETGWFYTDVVYYDYVGTTKWFRDGATICSRLPDGQVPSLDLGERNDDLVQVVRYTALNQPSYSSSTGGLGRPATVQWHPAITQYRYKHLGAAETPIDQKNRQIKMVITPGQIEHIARMLPAVGNDVVAAWDGSDTSRPSARLEAVAEALLTLDDDAVLVAGTGSVPNRTLLNFSERYTAYYEDPDPSYRDFLGRVKSEYSRPGEKGHARLVNYGYDRPGECPWDVVLVDVCRATKMFIGDESSTETDRYPFLLLGRVQREWEYSSLSDSMGGASGNPWKLKRVTRHRSEDRLMQAAAICNSMGPDGDIGFMHTRFLVVSTPVTVRSSVHEVGDAAPYEDTDTTNDNGLPDGRMWLDETVFDYSLRSTLSFPMGSIAISQPTASLTAGEKWLVDRLHVQEITGRTAGASGATGTKYLEPTPTGSAPTGMSAALFAANGQVTARARQRYTSPPTGSSWQAVSQTTYHTGWYAGLVLSDSARPDLVDSVERFAAAAAISSVPASADAIEKTETAYTFTASYTNIVTSAATKSERELVAEFGDSASGTIDTTYHFADGQVTQVDHPDGGLTLYEHHPINGQTTKITVSSGGSSPSTMVTTAIYDLSGHQLVVKTANGDAAAYSFLLAEAPAVQLTSPTGSGAQIGSLPPELGGAALSNSTVPVLCVVQWPRVVDSGKAAGPARVDWMSIDQSVLRSSTYTLTSSGAGVFNGTAPLASLGSGYLDKEVGRRMGVFMPSGAAFRSYSWPFTPDLLPSGKSEEVYTTAAVFNSDGAATTSTDALGNVSQPEYDGPGRTTRSRRGLSSVSPVSRTIFDGTVSANDQLNAKGVGPSRVTLSMALPDGAEFNSGGSTRATRTWYDQRGRTVLSCPVAVVSDASDVITYVVAGPYSVTQYDNLDRAVLAFNVAGDTSIADALTLTNVGISTILASDNVGAVKRTEYGQRGLVFRESTYVSPLISPTPPSGQTGRWVVTRHLYDVMGREIATGSAGQPVSKKVYDGLGRITATYTTAEDATSVSGLRSATGGRRLEYTTMDYIGGTSLVKRVTKIVRGHDDDSSTAASMGSSVTTYADTVYDAAARPTGTVDYGTNNVSGDIFANGSAPSVLSNWQASSGRIDISGTAGARKSETFYDERGLGSTSKTWITESPSTVTRTGRTVFDSLGRAYASVENCSGTSLPTIVWDTTNTRWKVSAWAGSPTADQDRVTSTVFNAAGNQTKRTAHVRGTSTPEGASQTTEYRYTWDSSDTPSSGPMRSPVPINGIAYETRFPDRTTGEPSTSASDKVFASYNALGESVASKDQRGVIHESVRDAAGRLVADKVSSFGSLSVTGAPTSVTLPGMSSAWTPTFSVDDRVKQISTRYDRFGRVTAVYTHSQLTNYATTVSGVAVDYGRMQESEGTGTGGLNNSSGLPNNILNYVVYQYDRAGDAIRVRQRLDDAEWQSSSTQAAPSAQQIRTYFQYTVPGSTFAFSGGASGDNGYEVTRRLDSVRYPGPADSTADAAGLVAPAHFNGVSMLYGSSGSINQTTGRVLTVDLRSDWPGTYPSSNESLLRRPLVTYQYVGVGTRAISDVVGPNIQSDRTVDTDRSRWASGGSWHYAGWDRFGRLKRQSWVEGGFATSTTVPALFQEAFTHDLGGRRLSRDQERSNSLFTDDDWRSNYDGLDRMTVAMRGMQGTSAFTNASNSQGWTLDELGNFKAVTSGVSLASTESRSHNANNELTQVGSGSGQKNRFYDQAGNIVLVTSGTGTPPALVEHMSYDAWNHLMKVQRPAPSSTISTTGGDYLDSVQHRYNGLSWRTVEWRRQARRESHTTGTQISAAYLAQARWFTYTGAWQIAQETSWRPWITSAGQWSVQHQHYGLRGIDDVIFRRADGNDDGCFGNDLPSISGYSTPGYGVDGGYYQLTDSQFSVIAHLDQSLGKIVHRYSYDSYGKLKTHALTDVDGDGRWGTTSDDTALADAISANDPRGDFNGDGKVNEIDQADYDSVKEDVTNDADSPACGVIGWGDLLEPRIGFCGYVRCEWTAVLTSTQSGPIGNNWWLARNRFYDPAAARWINRDPAGYTDGLSMYLYVRANPWGLVDPTGLFGNPPTEGAEPTMWSEFTKDWTGGMGWGPCYWEGVKAMFTNGGSDWREQTSDELARKAVNVEMNSQGGHGENIDNPSIAWNVLGEFVGAGDASRGSYGVDNSESPNGPVPLEGADRAGANLRGWSSIFLLGAAPGSSSAKAPSVGSRIGSAVAEARGALRSALKGGVVIDTNPLINTIEKGVAIDGTIAGRQPLVPIQAAKEFLAKGSKDALRAWMRARGARLASSASESEVAQLQKSIKPPSKLKIGDAKIAGSATREGVPVITDDGPFLNRLKELGIPGEEP